MCIMVRIYTLGPHKLNKGPAWLVPGRYLTWTFDRELAQREWDLYWREVVPDKEGRTKMTPQDYMRAYTVVAEPVGRTAGPKWSWPLPPENDYWPEDTMYFARFDYDGVAYKDVPEEALDAYDLGQEWRVK